MSAATARVPTLDFRFRAVRPIPSLGLAAGEALDLHVTAAEADGFDWGEMSAQLKNGTLESLSPPITCEAIKTFMEAIPEGAE